MPGTTNSGVNTPFSFSHSNAHAQYTQPFNRLRILPKYKWVRLYLGTSSMTFSNGEYLSFPVLGYAKLAWQKGLQVTVDSPLVPKEFLPLVTRESYEDSSYDFLVRYP